MKKERHTANIGSIEPHKQLLNIPSDSQLLYKVMTIENLACSISEKYLHFNRIDKYKDFQNADLNDGEQLPADRPCNARAKFDKSPDFSAEDYYDLTRKRTYACCFSLENSNHIWSEYANGNIKGKVCVIFNFGKLRAVLNQSLSPETAFLVNDGHNCHQIFSINYGIIEYTNWDVERLNYERLPNPIKYTFLKSSKKFSADKEFRISLSAVGFGQFILSNGREFNFPDTLKMDFNFKAAISSGVINRIEFATGSDPTQFQEELAKLGIKARIQNENG